MNPLTVMFGDKDNEPCLIVEVMGYEHPDTAEPANLDLLRCRVTARAGPAAGVFDIAIRLSELLEVRDYLGEINSGNGPSQTFVLAGGLLSLAFAPTRRGPVLCVVLLKTIDASHVRLEFLLTLEPQDLSRAFMRLSQLQVTAGNSLGD